MNKQVPEGIRQAQGAALLLALIASLFFSAFPTDTVAQNTAPVNRDPITNPIGYVMGTLLSPDDGSVISQNGPANGCTEDSGSQIIFSWTAIPQASSYDIYV